MAEVAESVSSKQGTAWSVETNPKYTRAWLDSLAPLDNLVSARELFQGLYALNRTSLESTQRLDLMQLYQGPVRDVCDTLQSSFVRVIFPMSAKLRRLGTSLCQLHIEMAYGYKLCLQDLAKGWLMPWRRRQLMVQAAERALAYLTEVLLRSYQLYLPYPAGVWRDAHVLYRLIELHGWQDERIEVVEGQDRLVISVSQRYRRLLMLGLANCYQMPYGECATVYRFLGRWIDQVRVVAPAARADGSGCFLADATVDTPPVPLGRAQPTASDPAVRLVDASELVRTLHVFLRRLEKGEPAMEMQIGIECLDSACHDMLQRLHRMYAQTATRRHSRIKRHETVMICAGIGALHFFSGGQKPFTPAPTTVDRDTAVTLDMSRPTAGDEVYISLDESEPVGPGDAPLAETFRVDRWHVRDVSAEGLLISQDTESRVRFRIGDILGIQRSSAPGQWSIGIVRWFKAQGEKGIEVGVELVAPDARPVSVRQVTDGDAAVPALMLPAVEAAHRPASMIVARGAVQVGKDCFVSGTDRATRRMRVLDTIEHTNSIEQVIVGNVLG